MPDLTPEKLAELRRMLDAATPRPWMACEDEDEVLIVLDDDSNHWPGRYTAIARGFEQGDDYGLSDAMLVTAAVNALPDLLDQLAAAEAALNDAILYENEGRDALARQTPHYLAAEAALARVRALHTPSRWYLDYCDDPACELDHVECNYDLFHDGDYRLVCETCSGGELEDTDDPTPYPCPTIRALDESEADHE